MAAPANAKSPANKAAAGKPPANSGGKRASRTWLGRLFALALVLATLGAATAAIGWWWLEQTLPDVFTFSSYQAIAHESSRVHAMGGEVVAQFGEEIRTVVPIERIPKTMLSALVCAEDAAFYSHPGLDFVGIARALWVDVTTGRYAQGASTITQQLAKTRYLDRQKTFTRKLKELVLARKLETRLSKDDILTLYANEVYFGHGRYGVEEAARFYFGKSVSEVSVPEAALLAGIVNSPAKFSPIRHPANALERRAYVLGQMLKHGYVSEADCARALATPLPVVGHDSLQTIGPYYMEAVRRFVLTKVDREQLLYGGLRIEVAMDVTMQKAADSAVLTGLQRLDAKNKAAQPVKHYKDAAEQRDGVAKLSQQQGNGKPPWGRVLLGIVIGHDDKAKSYQLDLGGIKGFLAESALGRYAVSADGKAEASIPGFDVGDLLRVSIRGKDDAEQLVLSPEFGPQAALVALEPQTRLVRALTGGDDFALHPFDRALLAKRQPGSTFKTFTYGAALEAGKVTPDDQRKDEAHVYTAGGKPWTPRNFSGHYDGKMYSMRDALAFSINSIAVAIAELVGPERVADFAHRAGIQSDLVAGLPLALGASGVSPFELANAYATLANAGKAMEPILVTRIVDRTGKDLYLAPRQEGRAVISEEVTRALTDMLGEVVRKGSGKDAQKVGRPIAGKTGTSNASRDTWFAGFSADLCAVVWVGFDDRKPMPKATGGSHAVPIWAEFMIHALDRVPPRPLPRLPHVLAGPLDPLAPAQPVDPEAAVEDSALDDPLPAQPKLELPPLPAKLREDSVDQ